MAKLKVFEAFSGIGAQRRALENIGASFEVVAISDIDKYALKSYEAIFGETENFGDITDILPELLPDFDLFTYSFPCQDISVAGLQAGLSGERSGLLFECEKIIKAKKPKFLLLENVKNLVGKKHRKDFEKWLDILSSYGYTNYWKVLNASDYGIPQNRERVFVVSVLDDTDGYHFPIPEKLTTRLIDLLEDEVDDVFWKTGEKIDAYLETVDYFPTNDIRLAQVGNYDAERRKGKAFDNPQTGRVYDPFGLCKTLDTMQGGDRQPKVILKTDDGLKVRKLTPLECWRLMGFNDVDFELAASVNSNSQLYKQAGNSIVVPILEGIFENLLSYNNIPTHANYHGKIKGVNHDNDRL